MSRFNHSVCDQCWAERFTGLHVVARPPKKEICCYCGREHTSGIRRGEDPERVPCGGKTGVHEEAS